MKEEGRKERKKEKKESSNEMTAGSIDPLSLIQVFLCCSYTGHKNGDEFVVFIDERAALVKRLDQRFALDNDSVLSERFSFCG